MPNEYSVVIGPKDNPLLRFTNAELEGWNAYFTVDLVGDELSIDEAYINVYQEDETAEYYSPADYDITESLDGFLFSTSWNAYADKIYEIPYGTAVRIYSDDDIVCKMYLDRVERIGREKYKIHVVSFIGLLDKKQHLGGIYNGATFEAVLNDILSFTTEDISVSIENDVQSVLVFGWLPIASARENLHQLLFSCGVAVTKGEDGNPVFSYIYDVGDGTIPQNRIFIDGAIRYPTPSTAIEVTEHTYLQLNTDEEVTLFDNTDTAESLDHATITFNRAPVHSIEAISTGFTIHETHPNYAVISGVGTLKGKAYTHIKRIIGRYDSYSDHAENIKKVENCTLVSVVNSENVADRMMSYYSVAKTVTADIVLDSEKCGRKYQFYDMYGEENSAFLSSMAITASGFMRAECEMLSGYVPSGQGNNYNHAVVITGSGTWVIPSEVFFDEDGNRKENPKIRAALVGGGDGGQAGKNGTSADVYPVHQYRDSLSSFTIQRGLGGTGGLGGQGGKIAIVTINCTGLTSFNYACGTGGLGGSSDGEFGLSGGDTTFGSFSSGSGVRQEAGYINPFSGELFAQSGDDGTKGGDGGYTDTSAKDYKAEDVSLGGYTWSGGSDGDMIRSYTNPQLVTLGGYGGGAAIGGRGKNGANVATIGNADNKGGDGGNGAPGEIGRTYGNGGGGGDGGGGGGMQGATYWTEQIPSSFDWRLYNIYFGDCPGNGGRGGRGGRGADGCIVIFY